MLADVGGRTSKSNLDPQILQVFLYAFWAAGMCWLQQQQSYRKVFFSAARCSDYASEIYNVSTLESFLEASHVADVCKGLNSVGTIVYTVPIASSFCGV